MNTESGSKERKTWTLWDLHEYVNYSDWVVREGKKMPCRLFVKNLWGRLLDARKVLKGEADAFTWPGGQ